jgi:maltose-binding protein MalE
LLTFFLAATRLSAWTNDELLIWVDADRGRTLEPIAQRFESDFGIKATIETPEKITALQIATDGRASARAALREAEANMLHR